MRNLQIFFFLIYFGVVSSQTDMHLEKTISIETENFVGCDYNYNTYYFSNTILSKNTEHKTLNYSNFLYGNITSVDITNPLKIVVFYREFNVIVLLDSQLNETDIIQIPYDISFATKGTANHLWLFTTNTLTIENYNFKTNTVSSSSLPLKNIDVLNMKSTENYVYLQTPLGIQTYDYLGNFISEKKIDNIKDFQFSNRILYTLSKDTIFQIDSSTKQFVFPSVSKIEKFYTLNNHFFIFDNSELYFFSKKKSNTN